MNSNPQTINIKELVQEFIVKSLTPARELQYRRLHRGNWQTVRRSRLRSPIELKKYIVTFNAVLFNALAVVHDIDFYELDELTLGHDYALISSTLKLTPPRKPAS